MTKTCNALKHSIQGERENTIAILQKNTFKKMTSAPPEKVALTR